MNRLVPVAAAAAVLFPTACGGDTVPAETGCYLLNPQVGESVRTALSKAVTATLDIHDPYYSPDTIGFQKSIKAINDSLFEQYDEQVPPTNLPRFDDVLGVKFTAKDATNFSQGGTFEIFSAGTLREKTATKTLPRDTLRQLAAHTMILVDCETFKTVAVPEE